MGAISPEEVPLPMDPLALRNNLGNLLRPLELIPSRERVIPTEWQVRTVLGGYISRAKVIPAQAPQYRQYALISDFLDLVILSFQEEAALATNWIKDQPEGSRLQNLTLATKTGRSTGSLPTNLIADVHNAINKCESLSSGRQFILHGNPSAIARDFSPYMAVLRRHFLPNAHFQCCMLLQGTFGYDFDIFAASGWKTRSRPSSVRLCPAAQFDFFPAPHLTRVSGQWLCSGRKTRDVSFD